MKLRICTLLIALLFSPTIFAANGGETYGGVQYSIVEIDLDGIGDVEPTALVGKLGVFVNDNIALEGRFGIGLQDDDIFGIDVDVERIIGFYGVFHANTGGDATVYGVLGFTEAEAELSIPGDSVTEDESDVSYGFGVNIGSINIEYMIYIDDEDDVDATAISIGFVSQF